MAPESRSSPRRAPGQCRSPSPRNAVTGTSSPPTPRRCSRPACWTGASSTSPGWSRQGYDDAHTDSTPLLIEPTNARSAAAPAGARAVRALPALNLTAVAAAKTGPFWSEISGQTSKRALTGGAKRIWLNGKVRGHARPQRSAGRRSHGVAGRLHRFAVSRSRCSTAATTPTHADLAGRIGPTKNFTTEEEHRGPGRPWPHVASIALGSGGGIERQVPGRGAGRHPRSRQGARPGRQRHRRRGARRRWSGPPPR